MGVINQTRTELGSKTRFERLPKRAKTVPF